MLRLLCLAHDSTCQDIHPWDPTETPSKTVEASDTWSTIFCQTEMSCCFVRCPWEEKTTVPFDFVWYHLYIFIRNLPVIAYKQIIHIYKDKTCIIIPSKYPCITRSYDRPFETALRWLSHIWHITTYLKHSNTFNHFRWLCHELTPQNQATGQYNTTGTKKIAQCIRNVNPIPLWMIWSLIISRYEKSLTFPTW